MSTRFELLSKAYGKISNPFVLCTLISECIQTRGGGGGKMTGRMRVKELMRKQGLSGEVVNLFPSWRTGIIHGDDGYDVTFNEDSLVVGLAYGELSLGMRVSYGVFFARGAKVPTAVNMQRVQADHTEAASELADKVNS